MKAKNIILIIAIVAVLGAILFQSCTTQYGWQDKGLQNHYCEYAYK